MAKARQVGKPHFLQFVFGKSLNISTPDKAISIPPIQTGSGLGSD
jgi:hypothetical protein